MRGIAAHSGGAGRRHLRFIRPYVLGVAALLATTVQAAYQDAAGFVELETDSVQRWQRTLVATPYGSQHKAQVALPVGASGPLVDRPVGLSTGKLGTPDETLAFAHTAPMNLASADPMTTGSVAVGSVTGGTPERAFPQVVRETKGNLLMSRTGQSQRLRVDPGSGGLMRMPRFVIEPPSAKEKSLIQSFRDFDPPKKSGKHVMVASLDPLAGFENVFAFQPLLTTPLEDVFRGRIDIVDYDRDRHCLATAIYFEARGESEAGQRAVAQVVLNRVLDYRYPDTVCGVVFQNQTWRNRCQFSFACDGQPERVNDKRSWSTAMMIAEEALDGDYFLDGIGDATHYHATYVNPRWSRALRKVEKVGTHIFYQLRPGQR